MRRSLSRTSRTDPRPCGGRRRAAAVRPSGFSVSHLNCLLIAPMEQSEQRAGSALAKPMKEPILNETETLSPVIPNELEEAHPPAARQRPASATSCFATAESCTGGMLASLLTDVQGVAHAFDRGFVTYTDEAKHEMLGVPAGADRGERRSLARSRGGDGGRRAASGRAPTSRWPSPALPIKATSPAWSISPARAPGVRRRIAKSISGRSAAAPPGSHACAWRSR